MTPAPAPGTVPGQLMICTAAPLLGCRGCTISG